MARIRRQDFIRHPRCVRENSKWTVRWATGYPDHKAGGTQHEPWWPSNLAGMLCLAAETDWMSSTQPTAMYSENRELSCLSQDLSIYTIHTLLYTCPVGKTRLQLQPRWLPPTVAPVADFTCTWTDVILIWGTDVESRQKSSKVKHTKRPDFETLSKWPTPEDLGDR